MAALTTNLPTETDSQQRFVNPAPATPSVLTSIFDFAGNVASVADKAWTSLDRGQATKLAAANQAAQNSAIKIIANQVFPETGASPSNIPPASQQAYTNSQPVAAQAAATQQAGAQGKLDPAMVQARTMSAFRQALAANPGHEFAVYQAFKEAGVSNMLTQQYDNAQATVQANSTALNDAHAALVKDAVEKYGYWDFANKSGPEQAVILAQVGLMNAQEADLTHKTALADLSLKNVQLTEAQRTDIQKTQGDSLLASANDYMTGQFSNLMKISINMLGDPTLQANPGRLEQLTGHLMNVGLPALDVEYQTNRAKLVGVMTSDQLSQLDANYQTQRKAFVDLISGPQSVSEMNKRVLENISTAAGIDYAKAAPTLIKVQKMIGPQAIGVLLSSKVQGNHPLMDLITNELNGVIKDPTKMPSFTEFVQSLNGTIDPSSWDPEKSRAMAPALLSATSKLALDPMIMNGTDKDGHKALMNSIKQTAGIAVDVVPQWGFGNVLAQSKVLNNRGITLSMFANGNGNKLESQDAIRAWIPANTQSYEVLSNMNSGDQFYTAKLDPHTLQWQAVWNGKMQSADGYTGGPNVLSVRSGMQFQQTKPSPSSAIMDQVSTLNHMLNNLAVAGSHGFDDSIKGASYQEARRYFATGELPQSVQKPATTKNGKTPEQNVDDTIAHMLDFVNKLPLPSRAEGGGISPAFPNKPTMDAYYAGPGKAMADNYKTYAPVVAQAAEAHGVPVGVAMNLIHHESRFNPTATSKQGASGLGQIMPDTAKAYGKDVTNLSPQENADLAMQVLSDNFKKTGNWKDAAAMYLTGRTIAKAGNAKDANGTTATAYAGAVVPASLDSWLPIGSDGTNNPYGYSRY